MPDPAERAIFRLASAYLRRDRELRLRLLPSLVPLALLPLISFASDSAMGGLMSYLLISLLGFVPITALESMRVSNATAASERFFFVPLESSAPLYHGMRKASLACVAVPFGLVVLAPTLILCRESPEAMAGILPALIVLPLFALFPSFSGNYLPFSQSPTNGKSARDILLNLSVLPIAILFAAAALRGLQSGRYWETLAGEGLLVALVHALWIRRLRRRRVPYLAA